jgi:uncharacterized protein
MARPKFFRDPVHIQIRFEDVNLGGECPSAPSVATQSWLARKIIDCPIFQRLRFIRQNGLSNLVFHGAEHTRFTHSLGVCHLAEIMHDRICRNTGTQQDDLIKLSTVIGALIHDVGHGPFSHTMEEILTENGVAFDHEKMTLRYILEPESQIHRLLHGVDPELPPRLAKFFDKTLRDEDHWSYKIVTSQLDADRLDYLHRDALFAGLRGHGFDLERILDLLSVHEGKSIGVERGALEAIEAYLVTLDLLYRGVYYHHAIRAASKMLTSLFRRAVKLHTDGDSTLFSPHGHHSPLRYLVEEGESIELARYSELNEYQTWYLIDYWKSHADPIVSELASRLLERRLFKTIPIDPQNVQETTRKIDDARTMTRELYPSLGDEVVTHFVMVDEPNRTSYKTYDWKAEAADESIWLIGGSKPSRPLEGDDESTIVNAFRNKRYFPRIIVLPQVRDRLVT